MVCVITCILLPMPLHLHEHVGRVSSGCPRHFNLSTTVSDRGASLVCGSGYQEKAQGLARQKSHPIWNHWQVHCSWKFRYCTLNEFFQTPMRHICHLAHLRNSSNMFEQNYHYWSTWFITDQEYNHYQYFPVENRIVLYLYRLNPLYWRIHKL